jgi:hypothetical protein
LRAKIATTQRFRNCSFYIAIFSGSFKFTRFELSGSRSKSRFNGKLKASTEKIIRLIIFIKTVLKMADENRIKILMDDDCSLSDLLGDSYISAVEQNSGNLT